MSDPGEGLEVRFLLEVLAERHGLDFRGYAPSSMRRRLHVARERLGCATLSQLQDRLLHDPAAIAEVVPALTVQVSTMFRDPAYFRLLREQVLPWLATWPSLKVWVPGCADGEELYSLVILFREAGLEARTLFYATDISEAALERARRGVYTLDRVAEFSRNYQQSGGTGSLADHYTAAYGAAAFNRSLRDHVVFASHNLAGDTVFAEVHMVSCRNTLIYFQPALQDRALGLFADTLVPGGILGLGAQESLQFSAVADRFDVLAATERIFRRRPA